MEAYDVNQSNTEEKRHDKTDQSLNDSNQTAENSIHNNQQDYYRDQSVFEYPAFSNEERNVIAQQIRQHIQLLTQMSLLTAKDEQWNELHRHVQMFQLIK